MAYRIYNNKKYGSACILFTSNDSITIAGNTSSSNVATGDETLAGASITQIWFGSPSGNSAYWTIKRGSNTVFVADSTSYIDFRGNGSSLNLDTSETLVANLTGSTAGVIIVEIKKIPTTNGFPNL